MFISPLPAPSATLDLNGIFYPGFLQKRRGSDLVYTTADRQVIESTVTSLLAESTDARRPGILLGQCSATI